MERTLKQKKVAFLATHGVEQVELTQPWQELEKAGVTVELIALEGGSIDGYNHLDKGNSFAVDNTVENVSADDYDALVLPGGVANPDALRMNPDAVGLVKAFVAQNKPVAAICHAAWLLVEADVVKGKSLTSYPSVQTDINNAGGHWVDETVHHEGGLITSRRPADLDAFCGKIIEVLSER